MNSFISKSKKEQSTAKLWASDLPPTEKDLFNLSSFAILDKAEGLKTTGTEAMLHEMLRFMLSSLPEDITLLKTAHDEQNWERTQQLAHKIKGGVVYVGAVRMKMACQYLERYWKSGERKLLEQLYQQLLQVINESMLEIEQWIKK